MDQQQPDNKNTQQNKFTSRFLRGIMLPERIGMWYLFHLVGTGLACLLKQQQLHRWFEIVLRSQGLLLALLYLPCCALTYLLLSNESLGKPYQRLCKHNRIIVESLWLSSLQTITILLLWAGDLLDNIEALIYFLCPTMTVVSAFVETYKTTK